VEKLRSKGVTSKIDVLELDVANDESIKEAVDHIRNTHGKLDSTCEEFFEVYLSCDNEYSSHEI
jgi:NAD(P)-dependent dehydrogenase (short-subunit alcohol dehydrogenase family)